MQYHNPLSGLKGIRYLYIAFLLSMLTSFGPLCTDMYLPSLPDIGSDLSLSTAYTQLSITACLLGLALGQIFVGPLSDGKGRRGLLLFSLLLYTLASLLCAVAQSGTSFLFFRFLQGLGGAGGLVLSRAICCDTYQGSTLTQFMAFLMAIHSVAPILGPVFGGFLAGLAGWRAIFFVLGIIGVLLVLGSFFSLPETLDPQKRILGGVLPSLKNMLGLFSEKAFLCYTGVQGFSMAGFFSYISATPFIYQNIYGLSMEQFSLIFGLNATGLTLVSLLTGALSKRFGDRCLLTVGNFLRTLGCVAVLVTALLAPTSPVYMIISLFIMVSAQGVTMTASFTLAIASQITGAGAASGLLGVAVFIFGALFSPLAGIAGPNSALPLGIIATGTGLIALLLGLWGNKAYETCPARTQNAQTIAFGKTKTRSSD